MAIDISFDKVTNATTVTDGTGYFDVLMGTLKLHIAEEWNEGRIKGTDYANVYLGMLQSAIQSAQQFALTEQLQEAQIEDVIVGTTLKEEQIVTEIANQSALEAKIRDEYGYAFNDVKDDIQLFNEPTTKHFQTVAKMVEDVTVAENTALASEHLEGKAEIDLEGTKAKVEREFGVKKDSEALGYVYDTVGTPTTTTVPKSNWEAAMYKANIEYSIGENTAKGYQADTYYKAYKSLQELMFALANAGVIEDDEGVTYTNIAQGMSDAMNAQIDIWENDEVNQPSATEINI